MEHTLYIYYSLEGQQKNIFFSLGTKTLTYCYIIQRMGNYH